MSKALTGAIEIAAGVALLASPIGGALGALWLPLVLSGAASELGALANLLQSQKGTVSTVRQAASPRRVIYGTQRVGGIEVYESTTGGSLDQYNLVIVFAAHEITNFMSLFLDGRECFWHGAGGGWSLRNGIGFGGGADGLQHTAPDGTYYTFYDAISGHRGVYCEPRFGDQPNGDYMTSLTANDGRWNVDAYGNTPSLYGHAYLYLKVEYNTTDFPNKPDARVLIAGKAVYDPRTGETAYSENWALIVADIIANTDYGLGSSVNVDNLIAAANICDEQVAFAGGGGGFEARYTANYTWTLDKEIGSVLQELMAGAGARFSYIEGEFYLFPATWYGATVSLTSDRLIAASSWSSQRKYKDKVNAVQGTYIAPQYPFNVAGNYYGFGNTNGDGSAVGQNNFNYCYQPTSAPTFTFDTTHGYPSNQYLLEDGNVELSMDMDLPSCLSVTQWQRLAKIALLRNRQQGSGSLAFGLEAWMLQPNDTFTFTMPQRGWTDKVLEVSQTEFSVENNEDGVPQIQVKMAVNEADPTVYEWEATDELTVYYDTTSVVNPNAFTTLPPTDMVLTSSAATALTQPDGTVIPRIQVTWNTPADSRVVSIQLQYQLVGASTWSDGGTVSVASNIAFINAVAGSEYDVQIRSLRANGGYSDWVVINGFTAGLLLSVGTQDGVGIGSLQSLVLSGGSVVILCNAFTAQYGYNFISIFPSGTVTLTNDGTSGGSGGALVQKTLYYVYYQDPTYTGGNVTPIATTNKADFLGKVGYFLIDSVVTPATASGSGTGGSGVYYQPSTYNAVSGTTNPTYAYDGDSTTFSFVEGMAVQVTTPGFGGDPPTTEETDSSGDCTWLGFPSLTTSSALNLYITSSGTTTASYTGADDTSGCEVTIGSTTTGVLLTSGTTTIPIPSGTNLSTVSVRVQATPPPPPATTGRSSIGRLIVEVDEIYIST